MEQAIIIQFRNRVFFIHPIYLYVLVVLFGFFITIFISSLVGTEESETERLLQNKKNSLPSKGGKNVLDIRGGNNEDYDIVDIVTACLSPNEFYEVVNPEMKEYIRKVLKLLPKHTSKSNKILLIKASVFILAGVVRRNDKSLPKLIYDIQNGRVVSMIISLFGLSQPTIIRRVLVYLTFGIGLGFSYINVMKGLPLLKLLKTISLILAITFGSTTTISRGLRLDCAKEILAIRPEINKHILIDSHYKHEDRIFIDTTTTKKLSPIYVTDLSKKPLIVETLDGPQTGSSLFGGKSKVPSITITKTRKYVPLKERTKTLSDIKSRDDAEVREEVAKLLKKYNFDQEIVSPTPSPKKEKSIFGDNPTRIEIVEENLD